MAIKAKQQYSISLPGYVLDSDSLARIDRAARLSLGYVNKDTIKLNVICNNKGNVETRFSSIDEIVDATSVTWSNVYSISLQYSCDTPLAAIYVTFNSNGRIDISTTSRNKMFNVSLDQLKQTVLGCDQQYSLPIKLCVFGTAIRKSLFYITTITSLVLLTSTANNLYAHRIGVNIDKRHIPIGNDIFREIGSAIDSKSQDDKLNAILKYQLRGFTNVSEIIESYLVVIKCCLILMTILLLSHIILYFLRRTYPVSFFLFGQNKNVYSKHVKTRDTINTVIVLGFIVNIVAGIALLLLSY